MLLSWAQVVTWNQVQRGTLHLQFCICWEVFYENDVDVILLMLWVGWQGLGSGGGASSFRWVWEGQGQLGCPGLCLWDNRSPRGNPAQQQLQTRGDEMSDTHQDLSLIAPCDKGWGISPCPHLSPPGFQCHTLGPVGCASTEIWMLVFARFESSFLKYTEGNPIVLLFKNTSEIII